MNNVIFQVLRRKLIQNLIQNTFSKHKNHKKLEEYLNKHSHKDHEIDGKALTLLRDRDIDNLVTKIGARVKFRCALR